MLFGLLYKITFLISAFTAAMLFVMGPVGLIAYRGDLFGTKGAKIYWTVFAGVFWFCLVAAFSQCALQAGLMFGMYLQ